MSAQGPLSPEEIEQFHTLGYIKVRAFPIEEAAEMEDTIWRGLAKDGVLREEPSTWGRYPGGLSRSVRNARIFKRPFSADFAARVDQLLGSGTWDMPPDRGSLLYTFPESRAWDVQSRTWHWHGDPMRNVGGLRDLFVFCFLTPVQPQGGGTVFVEGSHRVVCEYLRDSPPEIRALKVKDIKKKFFASHPWLRALTDKDDASDRRQRLMQETTEVNGHPLRVVELTGEPGEAYITHMSTMHARSFNVLDRPRFMTAKNLCQRDEPGASN